MTLFSESASFAGIGVGIRMIVVVSEGRLRVVFTRSVFGILAGLVLIGAAVVSRREGRTRVVK